MTGGISERPVQPTRLRGQMVLHHLPRIHREADVKASRPLRGIWRMSARAERSWAVPLTPPPPTPPPPRPIPSASLPRPPLSCTPPPDTSRWHLEPVAPAEDTSRRRRSTSSGGPSPVYVLKNAFPFRGRGFVQSLKRNHRHKQLITDRH